MKHIVATLLVTVVGLSSAVVENFDDVALGGKGGTVKEVVKMLKDMLKKSKEDGEKDRDLAAKFICYCDDNQAEKKENIEKNEEVVKTLGASIDKLRGENGKLSTDCGLLEQDIADNEAAREEAEGIRKKAEEDFKAEETDMQDAISSMEEAIEVLGEIGADQKKTDLLVMHSTKNFLTPDDTNDDQIKLSQPSMLKLKSVLKSAMQAASVQLTQKQKRVFDSFIQAPFTGTYQSQSGEIVGILKNMKETFEANLKQAQQTEKAQKEAHEKFMKTKKEAFDTMKESFDDKQSTLGSNDESLSSDMEEFEAAKTSLAEDTEFLSKLTPMCADKEKELTKRKMMRANEEAAISQAVAILSSGADTFKKAKDDKGKFVQVPSFIQIASYDQDLSSTRNAVKGELQGEARQMKSLKLAHVAALLELGNPFADVLDEIKKMLKLLDEEQKSDEEQKEWCESEREETNSKKEDLESKVEELENKITELDDDMNKPEEGLKDTIKQTEKDIKENREAQGEETGARKEENMAYQKSVRNMDDAQEILGKAIAVLKKFYEGMEKEQESLLRLRAAREDPEPPKMGEYKDQSKKGNKVIGMIEDILKESEEQEAEAHKDEEQAQHAYEDSMQDLKDEQTKLEEELAKAIASLAEKKKLLEETHQDVIVTEKALKEVERYLKKIKPGCDFYVDNFDKREENRGKEKKALKKAAKTLKGTPAFKKAELEAEQESWAEKGCKEVCVEDSAHAKCKACLAGVSVPGYCVTHKDTPGC